MENIFLNHDGHNRLVGFSTGGSFSATTQMSRRLSRHFSDPYYRHSHQQIQLTPKRLPHCSKIKSTQITNISKSTQTEKQQLL